MEIDRTSDKYLSILGSILAGMFHNYKDSFAMVAGNAIGAADSVCKKLDELAEADKKPADKPADKAADKPSDKESDKPAADKVPADSKLLK